MIKELKPRSQAVGRIGAVGAVAICAGLLSMLHQPQKAEALANPITTVKNRVQVVTKTVTQVKATGQKCNLVICNVDVGTRAFPVYYGGLQPDAGPINSTVGLPICDNSVAAFTACSGTCFSFDVVPDAISLVAGAAMPDGGIPVRVMEGTGCSQP